MHDENCKARFTDETMATYACPECKKRNPKLYDVKDRGKLL